MLNLRNVLIASAALMAAAIVFVGCSSQSGSQPPVDPVSADWQAGLDEDVVEGLAQLSDADRGAALTQKVCPVTDKPLGSMGEPPKVMVEGREVFLCCTGCEEEIKSNPDEYLGKLDNTQ